MFLYLKIPELGGHLKILKSYEGFSRPYIPEFVDIIKSINLDILLFQSDIKVAIVVKSWLSTTSLLRRDGMLNLDVNVDVNKAHQRKECII